MGLNYDQIADLVLDTQEKLIKRGAFLDMQTDLTDHVAVREMWDGHQHQFDGGNDWRFDIMMDHNHSARTVEMYETDGSSLGDSMVKGLVSPRHINAHYIYDLREPDFQRGGLAVTNHLKTKYIGMMVSFYELMEEILWGKPVDSSDKKTPYGVSFWVTKNATEGLNGGNPAGFADGRAGVSTVTYPRFANWTAQYAQVSKTDLIRKMRRAHRKTQFRSPVSHATPNVGSMKNGIYTNDTVIGIMEELLEAGNMSLGNELASKDGRSVFKSTPVTYAPKLDDDSSDPVMMLDWKHLFVGIMAGWKNNLSKPAPVPGKHLVRRVDLDASFNMVGTDLRRQTVISK